jgi:hypothetical protein
MAISSISELVAALGGRRAVADLLKIEPHAVSMWSERGFIPSGWHLRLFTAVYAQGRSIDPALFELPPGTFDAVVPVSPSPGARSEPRRRRA